MGIVKDTFDKVQMHVKELMCLSCDTKSNFGVRLTESHITVTCLGCYTIALEIYEPVEKQRTVFHDLHNTYLDKIPAIKFVRDSVNGYYGLKECKDAVDAVQGPNGTSISDLMKIVSDWNVAHPRVTADTQS